MVLVTGGFDPIHSGHISYFKEAKKITNYLIVGLNSDDWLKRKKGNFFLPWKERAEILNNINFVDEVIDFNDQDNTAIDAIEKCLCIYDKVVFANGGDSKAETFLNMIFLKKIIMLNLNMELEEIKN